MMLFAAFSSSFVTILMWPEASGNFSFPALTAPSRLSTPAFAISIYPARCENSDFIFSMSSLFAVSLISVSPR